MNLGYKIAAALVLLLLGTTWYASYYGWGLRSTAEAEALRRAQSIRPGSGGRGFYGGGYRYGK